MKLKKCSLCGQLFPDVGVSYCSSCMEKMDEQFLIVRDYLYDNPYASIEEVSENTEVPNKLIIQFLKDGRLSIVNATGLLRCEQCGTSIDTGRFCAKCTQKIEERMVKPFMAAQKNKANKPVGPRMHTERDTSS